MRRGARTPIRGRKQNTVVPKKGYGARTMGDHPVHRASPGKAAPGHEVVVSILVRGTTGQWRARRNSLAFRIVGKSERSLRRASASEQPPFRTPPCPSGGSNARFADIWRNAPHKGLEGQGATGEQAASTLDAIEWKRHMWTRNAGALNSKCPQCQNAADFHKTAWLMAVPRNHGKPPSGWPLQPPSGWPPPTARTGGWRSPGWPKESAMKSMIREVRLQVHQAFEERDGI